MELDFTSDIVEKLLFKRMLVDKNWMSIITNIFDERWFRTKNLASLIKITLKYYQKYSTSPDFRTLSLLARAYCEKHPYDDNNIAEINSLINEISNISLNISDDIIQANLKEFVRKNAFSFTLLDNSDILANSENEKSSELYQKTIDKCLENFDKVQKITFNDTDLGFDYFNESAMDNHWNYLKNPESKIKTGWQSLDYYTNGGFLKDGRMLGLFMAQAGLGKSVFLSNLAVNFLKQNLSVVVISLEMSEDVYAQRFDAHISKKNINKLGEFEESAKARIKDFYKNYPESNLIIKEYPPRSINSNQIDNYLENLKSAGKKIDVLIVDYLNLVLPNKRTDSMFKDGMSVSEELRALSYKYKIPVISACQSNSEGMNNADIDMQNVSESRGVVHTVDCLFAIFQTPEQRDAGILGFKVIKNRLGGMVGKHSSFKMDPETLVVSDITYDTGDNGIAENTDNEFSKLLAALPEISSDIGNL